MEVKNNVIYIGRIEEENSKDKNSDEESDNEEKKEDEDKENTGKFEKVVYIGRMEDNENFEEDPNILEGALNTLVESSGIHKTNIYEVSTHFEKLQLFANFSF